MRIWKSKNSPGFILYGMCVLRLSNVTFLQMQSWILTERGEIVARLEDNAISLPIDVYTSIMQGRLSQQRFSGDEYLRL